MCPATWLQSVIVKLNLVRVTIFVHMNERAWVERRKASSGRYLDSVLGDVPPLRTTVAAVAFVREAIEKWEA
jgi:hypothetical protein